MNVREFVTQALLSSHQALLAKVVVSGDRDELAHKVAEQATAFAMALTVQWKIGMEVFEQYDQECQEENPSTMNFTEPWGPDAKFMADEEEPAETGTSPVGYTAWNNLRSVEI